jgi:hypothetical protein
LAASWQLAHDWASEADRAVSWKICSPKAASGLSVAEDEADADADLSSPEPPPQAVSRRAASSARQKVGRRTRPDSRGERDIADVDVNDNDSHYLYFTHHVQ